MEAGTGEPQPAFLGRSPTCPFPWAHGHLNHSPGKLVARLCLCLGSTTTSTSSTQRAEGEPLICPWLQRSFWGPLSDPMPGSWPAFSMEHSEGPGFGL